MFKSRIRYLYRNFRFKAKVWKTIRKGPTFHSSLDCIVIDLTTNCDLSCIDCNRSCSQNQAPSIENITVEQINRFLNESKLSGHKWKRIQLEGGEPTLHPEIDKIIEMVLQYKKNHASECEVRLCTNGNSQKSKNLQNNPPEGLKIYSSDKFINTNNGHFPFNIAPCDLTEHKNSDFSNGCYIYQLYSLGLTKSGYYPHAICGGIDRVFGFDLGLKKLPMSNEDFGPQMKKLCRYCGHFIQYSFKSGKNGSIFRIKKNRFEHGTQSESWLKAYSEYKKKKPSISLY